MKATAIMIRAGFVPWLIIATLLAFGHVDAADSPEPPKKEAISSERVAKLIRQLGDNDYFVRQRAEDELAQYGFEVFDAINAATTDDDPEIVARAKYLLKLMRIEWTAESDPPKVKALLQDYESVGPVAREERIEALADLPDGQGTAALCRLVRFERSPLLSRAAALAMMHGLSADEPPDLSPDAVKIAAIRKTLDTCKRSGALWLLAWTRLGSEPDAAVAEWTRLADDELGLLQQAQMETNAEIAAGVIRIKVACLQKLGRTDEALKAMRRLVEVSPGDPESLDKLLEWLVKQKAWKAVDDLAQRFAPQLIGDPSLLYALAEAYGEQGLKGRMEETAARAFSLNPGKQEPQLISRLRVARRLVDQGRFVWARRELDYVIAQGDLNDSNLPAVAQRMLSEMLHDQGEDFDAAETLAKMLQAWETVKRTEGRPDAAELTENRSRMHYFFACHWESKNDLAKQRESLDKALEVNQTDIEALIACYHLPEQTPEYHAKIVERIQRSANELYEKVAQEPNNMAACNQYAWLVGNTEGDQDRALKCSEKAVEASPRDGGLVDTLARVHFARGDLEGAVKLQAKAAEMEPHSGLIRRQLEVFRKKLEEKKTP
jgi:tetratricopeptide (TPR) repeat protein